MHGSASVAQPYPSKSIRLIVRSSAGGGGDTLARLVGSAVLQWACVSIIAVSLIRGLEV